MITRKPTHKPTKPKCRSRAVHPALTAVDWQVVDRLVAEVTFAHVIVGVAHTSELLAQYREVEGEEVGAGVGAVGLYCGNVVREAPAEEGTASRRAVAENIVVIQTHAFLAQVQDAWGGRIRIV